MESEKELLLETEQDTEQEEQDETEKEESEDSQDADESEAEEKEESETEEEKDEKADTKAEKRINKLTAINKSLQEQLKEAKDALDEAKESLDRKDKALEEERKDIYSKFEYIHTRNGKQMSELSDDEFDQLVDELYAHPDSAEGKKLLAECRAQRKLGKPLLKKQEEVEAGEQQLWEYEWGIITKAVLDEETGNPELKKHVEKLASEIAPIFQKRKADKELGILYRQLTEGGVDAKMKHLTRLMKKMNLFTLIQPADVEAQATTSKGKKAPVTTKEKTFTRAQIAAMSAEEFEKNEGAIDKAMKAGRIK
ncbi:MAG: hypothetical protein K0Q50_713 [Vampirovibrio sp.]|jgi:hypothetical protein|nr:hypothetical protein [Vampirovibrio sp.]